MLMPKKAKWRKQSRGRMRGQTKGGDMVSFGEYGLKALQPCWITSRQIEAVRVTISRTMSRTGKMWIRVFPDVPVTAKPIEVRMGKGKGSVDRWVAKIKPGRVMFEVDGVAEDVAMEALRLAAMKLSVKSRFVKREDW